MNTTMDKIRIAITSIWRIHIGISSAITLVVIAAIIYKYLLKDVLRYVLAQLSGSYDPSSVPQMLLLGITSSLIAAVVFGFLGVFLFGWYSRIRLTGKYNVFEIDEHGNETPWGKVTIKYHPLIANTYHTPVKILLKHNDIIMEGDGQIIDNRYLAGHYSEVGKPERRRSGSFMYELEGSGNVWSGDFICIDPDHQNPVIGKAKWIRE